MNEALLLSPMGTALVECVPNFSEGRDSQVIEAIIATATGIPGCHLLSAEPDSDYNRTVVTLAGESEAVSEAAFRLISAAKEHIDMRNHSGEHPRLGAVDVCPFIPLREISMEECANLALLLGQRVSQELGLPVYHYGSAASDDSRRMLSTLRKGEYEGLQDRLTEDDEETTQEALHGEDTRWPDQGPRIWNDVIARFGAVVIGARDILVAYNVNLDEADARVSKLAGTLVRSSGRLVKREDGSKIRIPGMLTKVQGMGVTLEGHGISQVSMNLLDVSTTPLHFAYEAVKSIAGDHGVEVCGSELVGLVPLSAMIEAGKWYHDDSSTTDQSVLVSAAIRGLGLDSLNEFNPAERIIELAIGDE